MEDKLIESVAYILPAAVTGFVAYYIFNKLIMQQNSFNKVALISQRKKEALPIKLQAYERLLLFCERINPVKILVRIKPITENTQDYLQLLIANIDQEFEHNLVQQMYITDDTWTAVVATKNTTINKLRKVAETAKTANELREKVIMDYSKTTPPTDTAIGFIKNEVKKLL